MMTKIFAVLLASCVYQTVCLEYYMDNAARQCGVLIPYVVGPDLNDSKILMSWDPDVNQKNLELNECTMKFKAYNRNNKVEKLLMEFIGGVFFKCNSRDPLGITELQILDGSSTSSSNLRQYTCGTDIKEAGAFTTSGDHVTIVLKKGDRYDEKYEYRIKITAIYENEDERTILSGGAIAGIVIAAVLIIAVLVVTVFYMIRTFNMQCAGGLSKQLGFSSTQNIPSSMTGEVILGVDNSGFRNNSPTRTTAPNQMLAMPQNGSVQQGGARPKTYNQTSHAQGASNSLGYDKGIDIFEDSPKSTSRKQLEDGFDEVDINDGRQSTYTVPVEINPKMLEKQEKFQLDNNHYTCNYESPNGVKSSSSNTSNDRHSAQPTGASRWDRTDSYFVATRENGSQLKPWRPLGPEELLSNNGPHVNNRRHHANSIDETMSEGMDSGISSRSNSDRFLKNDDGIIAEDKSYSNLRDKRGVKVPSVKDTFV